MKFFISLAVLCFSHAVLADAGFKNGNNLTVVDLKGNVQITCEDEDGGVPLHSYFNCSGWTATPGTHDYFVTTEKVDANKLELSCTHSGGIQAVKKTSYDKNKQSSKNRINLLVSSLTQKPLLEAGKNNVEYKLKKGNSVVSAGSFNVEVDVSEQRSCRNRSIYTFDSSYCRNQFAGCDYYFHLENNCQY